MQLHDRIVGSMDLKNNQKAHILEALANSDKCLIDGADEYLQLLATTSLIMNEMNK
jgi:replication factor C subunit 2/4